MKKGQKALKRNAKVLKAHYPWEYNEPSDWINIHYCPKDEILMVASDEGDRYLSYYCTLQSSGSYTVEVYGGTKGDSLVNSQTMTVGVQWNYQLPLGYGKPCSLGYTTYKIRFYPATANKIITFKQLKHTSSSNTNESVLLVNANCSTLTSFSHANDVGAGTTPVRLKYVNIYGCTGLTTLWYAISKCPKVEYFTLPKTLDYLAIMEGMCVDNVMLKGCKLPKYLDNVTNAKSAFKNCPDAIYIDMPISMNKVTEMGGTSTRGIFDGDYKLKELQYPLNMVSLTAISYANNNCTTATHYRLPSNAPNVTDMSRWFLNNYQITSLELPRIMNKVTTAESFIVNDTNLGRLIMPDSMILCTNLNNNSELWNLDSISTCVWGSGQCNTYFTIRDLKTFKQPTLRVSKLTLRGNTLATKSQLHTINIDWANSTYGGTTPQIDIRWNSLSATTIDAIFTALPVVVGKTINVSGNPGSATCTPTIASLKGWTVIII